MKTCVLQFPSLTDLAAYLKRVQPTAYTINTLRFTLSAPLSAEEQLIAVKQFQASATLAAFANSWPAIAKADLI
jgi:hypothetical protein